MWAGKMWKCCAAALVLRALAAGGPLQAAIFTWDGGSATTSNWTDALNWSTNLAPANDGTSDIIFAGAIRPAPFADVAHNINSLQFANGSAAFTLAGFTLTINSASGIDNKDDSVQTIQNAISLGSSQTWFSGDGFATGNLFISGSVLTNGRTLTSNPLLSSSITLNGNISGTGGLSVAGSGTTVLTGATANTYSGPTNVVSGTLSLARSVANGAIPGDLNIGDGSGGDFVQLGGSNQISDTSTVSTNAGVLDLNGFNETIGTLNMTGGTVGGGGASTLSIGGSTITTNASSSAAFIMPTAVNFLGGTKTFVVADGAVLNDLDFFGGINSAPGGIIKAGPGTMRFAGTNSNIYTTLTSVNEGTLVLNRPSFTAISGNLVIGDGIGGANADVVRQDGGNQVGSTATTTINSSGLLDITLFPYATPNIILNGGNITSSIGGVLRTFGTLTSNAAATTATISGTGIIDLNGGFRTYTVNDGAPAVDLDISLSIINGGLNKAGPGTLVLSGNAANNYTNGTAIIGGTLALAKTPGVVALPFNVQVGNNPPGPLTEILRLDASNQIADSAGVGVNGTGQFNLNGFSETINALSMTGGNVALNGGTLTILSLISTNNATVAGTIAGPGTLNLGGGTRTFDIVQPPVPIAVGMDISAVIANGEIIKTNQGTLQFSGVGSNTYSGQTYVQQGTLLLAKTGVAVPGFLAMGNGILGSPTATVRLAASGQLGNSAGNYLSMNEGGLLDMNGFGATIRDLKLWGGDITQNGGTLTMLGDAFANTNSVSTISGGTLDLGGAAKVIDLTGEVDIQSRLANGVLAKLGPGTLRLGGNNSSVTALNEGTLLIGNDQALGIANLIVNGGTFSSDGIARVSPQPALILGPAIVDEPASLTLQSFSGNGSLTKNGVGTLAFTSPSTFAGPITLNTGTMSASLTSNNSFTQNGGTFSGTLINIGTFTYNGGAFNGTLVNDGSVVLNADFTAASGMENHSSLTVSTGRTLTVNGSGLKNLGTFTLNGGTVAGSAGVANDFSGVMNARGTLSGPLTNLGTLQTTGLLVASLGGNNFGNITIFSTQSLSLGAGFSNFGTMNLYSGSIGGTSTLQNSNGGTIQGAGGISAAVTNSGVIFANSSLPLVITNMTGGNTAGGELRIADGGLLNVINPFSSAGTVVLQGSNATIGGGTITNTGTIRGKGRVGNTVNNSGVIRAEDGLLSLAGASSTNSAGGNIQAPAGATVFYNQGLASNVGTIALSGGTFDTNATAINNTGVIDGRGIFRSGGLTNNNKIAIADGPSEIYGNVLNKSSITITNTTATFFNNVTNDVGATIKTTAAVSRFLATYINNGTFISDPSDNFFDSLSIGDEGALVGGVGDRFFVSGDLINSSRANQKWNTAAAELHLAGALRHLLSVPGDDHGISFSGYDNNFAWGSLTLSAGEQLALDGQAGEALYLHSLLLGGGIDQINSITGDGVNIYYDLRDPANSYLNGQTYALAGGGQIAAVPEPSSIIFFCWTALLMLGRRRREHVLL